MVETRESRVTNAEADKKRLHSTVAGLMHKRLKAGKAYWC